MVDRLINHVNVHALPTARESAAWSNALQALAATTPHSIPVTVSTDPRHSQHRELRRRLRRRRDVGLARAARASPPCATRSGSGRSPTSPARSTWRSGIRSSLHPQIDLGTEPRWGRQFHTFGNDSAFVAEVAAAYVEGFQLDRELGPTSVATMAKHFPGGGPQRDGEDPHFPYGREQVYPGGRFEDHLVPFRRAIDAGTAALMPYYGMPVGLALDGEPVEEVGFGYNRQILTGLLREELGYDGVVCTDWGLVTGTVVAGRPLPARAWGVEHLSALDRVVRIIDAGADQLGGESRTELLLEAVEQGLVSTARIDESVRRLLLVKFRLGLFDDPFVDEDAAEEVVGRADFRAAGHRAQAESMVLLENRAVDGTPLLPLRPGLRLYVEGWPAEEAARLGVVVDDPADADVAVVRLAPPFDPRDDLFLEAFFHQGSLAYRPGLVARLREIARTTPLILDADLERPALLAAFADVATVLVTHVGRVGRGLRRRALRAPWRRAVGCPSRCPGRTTPSVPRAPTSRTTPPTRCTRRARASAADQVQGLIRSGCQVGGRRRGGRAGPEPDRHLRRRPQQGRHVLGPGRQDVLADPAQADGADHALAVPEDRGAERGDADGAVVVGDGVAAGPGGGQVRPQGLLRRQARRGAGRQARPQHARQQGVLVEGEQGARGAADVQRLRTADVQLQHPDPGADGDALEAHGLGPGGDHQVGRLPGLDRQPGQQRRRHAGDVEALDEDRADLERPDRQPERVARAPLEPAGDLQGGEQPVGGRLRVAGAADELRQRQLGLAPPEALEQADGAEHGLDDRPARVGLAHRAPRWSDDRSTTAGPSLTLADDNL